MELICLNCSRTVRSPAQVDESHQSFFIFALNQNPVCTLYSDFIKKKKKKKTKLHDGII
jgi:hypothetical protein